MEQYIVEQYIVEQYIVEQYIVEQYIAIYIYIFFFNNMYRIAIFLQYDVHLILLVELPAHNLLCTCVMRAFTAFTEIL